LYYQRQYCPCCRISLIVLADKHSYPFCHLRIGYFSSSNFLTINLTILLLNELYCIIEQLLKTNSLTSIHLNKQLHKLFLLLFCRIKDCNKDYNKSLMHSDDIDMEFDPSELWDFFYNSINDRLNKYKQTCCWAREEILTYLFSRCDTRQISFPPPLVLSPHWS